MNPDNKSRRGRLGLAAAGGVLAGVAVLGAVGAAAANAAPLLTSASPSASSSTGSTTTQRGDEAAVTGTKAATLKAAALKAVPGATVERIETDADGAAYEVHLKKTDGSEVTVKFDANLAQTGIEAGRGSGGNGETDDGTSAG